MREQTPSISLFLFDVAMFSEETFKHTFFSKNNRTPFYLLSLFFFPTSFMIVERLTDYAISWTSSELENVVYIEYLELFLFSFLHEFMPNVIACVNTSVGVYKRAISSLFRSLFLVQWFLIIAHRILNTFPLKRNISNFNCFSQLWIKELPMPLYTAVDLFVIRIQAMETQAIRCITSNRMKTNVVCILDSCAES